MFSMRSLRHLLEQQLLVCFEPVEKQQIRQSSRCVPCVTYSNSKLRLLFERYRATSGESREGSISAVSRLRLSTMLETAFAYLKHSERKDKSLIMVYFGTCLKFEICDLVFKISRGGGI